MKDELTQRAHDRQVEQEHTRETDAVTNLQETTSSEPTIGMRIDALCNYGDDADNSDILKWSQGLMQQISNGSNIQKAKGGWHKKGHVLILWDANETHNKSETTSFISLPKSLHNKKVKASCKIGIAL